MLLSGCAVLSFGLYNIHSFSDITEGGVLGLTLLIQHLFQISPAVSGLILNAMCYFIGWRVLGGGFVINSAVAGVAFSAFYALFEKLGPVYPKIAGHPLAAAVIGAVFVGIGAGTCVCANGAPTGDDALAMSISKKVKVRIEVVYLVSDVAVLALSLIYIQPSRIMYSLLSVVISGQIIGLIQKPRKQKQ